MKPRAQILRRDLLQIAAALGVTASFGSAAGAASSPSPAPRPEGEPEFEPEFGPAAPFDFDILIARARALAAAPYAPPSALPAAELADVDYDAHWKIVFREEATMTPAGDGAPVQFFHPARFFPDPVAMHVVADGEAREALFSDTYFTMPDDSPAKDLPDVGFAGLRVMRPAKDGKLRPDWISFLGASYFRTDGPEGQYGLSARGLALDTGLSTPEEFPRFSAFWIGPAEAPEDDLTIWALLESPSIAGAYRFGLQRGGKGEGHRTSVSVRLFVRQGVERLGIAPLTSMYWYSERDRMIADDWRPEIHDSDGLALATGSGERIWRALDNPERVRTSSYFDENPKGFGLSQRDRAFENYQDDGVFYNKRASVWVEPLGDWGRGAVQLVQIPTADETFDNIVAYWTPERPPKPGDALSFDYALHWVKRDPEPEVASVIATRQGQGGVPGQPIPKTIDKMAVDFEGPALAGLDAKSGVIPVVEARLGRVLEPIAARPIVGADNRWRLTFDFEQEGTEPVEIRAYLALDGKALTETWLAQAMVDRPRRGR
ncbi:MAG: glucan biosynthesis protein D [Paracoccaceae bacterium]